MKNIDDIRALASTIRHAAQDMEHAADFLRQPRPDEMPDLIRRINARGYTITIWQGNDDSWWVSLSRGGEYIMSAILPDPITALQDALNRTAVTE